MNIFASYPCPIKSAYVLDDQRLVKMILESCQLLSTVAMTYGRWQPGYPAPTHQLHACVLWTAAGRDNWDWLWEHAWTMDEERRSRWGRQNVHKTLDACHRLNLSQTRKHIPLGSTRHPNCARNLEVGVDFTHIPDVHLAYRLYLSARWKLQPKPAVCTILGSRERGWQPPAIRFIKD